MEDKLYVLFSVFACASCGQGVASFEWKPTGMAFRVPIVDVSVVDLSVRIEKPATYEQVKAAIKEESESKMKGILCYTKDDVVSTDFVVEKSQIRRKGDGEMKHLEAAGSEGSKDE